MARRLAFAGLPVVCMFKYLNRVIFLMTLQNYNANIHRAIGVAITELLTF